MSILRHGIDLVECDRIARLIANHGQRFLDRVLTAAEQDRARSFHDPTPFVAGRWAAKEAILKMIGTGWRGKITWTDMEVLPDTAGRPLARLSGETARVAQSMGVTQILVSITHTRQHAAASVIGLSG